MIFRHKRRRMKIVIVLLVVLLLVVLGHRRQQRNAGLEGRGVDATSVATSGAGDHEYKVKNGNETRKYLVHVPKSYTATKATPLVFFFHGGGGWMEQAAADYGWIEKSEKEGVIVVFGNGSSRLPRERLATWNAGNCCGYARDNNIDDVAYAKAVVADVETKFNIDKQKIFATGMSNGGIMSHRLACEASDVFTAVAAVAGTDGMGASCVPTRPISVMHIHAKNDDHVLFGGGAGPDAFRDESKVADFTSVADTIALWIKRNALSDTPKRVLDVPGAYCDLYTSPTSGVQVKLCVTEDGGHSWAGGKAVRGKTPSTAIIANDVIWDFFKAQTK